METNERRLQLVTDQRTSRAHFLIGDRTETSWEIALCGAQATWHSTRVVPLGALCPTCVRALALQVPAPARAGGPLT